MSDFSPRSHVFRCFSETRSGFTCAPHSECHRVSEAAVSPPRNLLIPSLQSCSLHTFWRGEIMPLGGFLLHRKTLSPRPHAQAYFLSRSVVHLLEKLTFWLPPHAPLSRRSFPSGAEAICSWLSGMEAAFWRCGGTEQTRWPTSFVWHISIVFSWLTLTIVHMAVLSKRLSDKNVLLHWDISYKLI